MKKSLFLSSLILIIISISNQETTAQLYEQNKQVADVGLYFPTGQTILKAGLSVGVAENLGAGAQIE